MNDLISRQAVIDLFKKYQPRMATSVIEFGNALKGLPVIEAEPKWIPVGERLPEESDDYLVTIYFGEYGIHETDYACFNLEKSEWSFHGRYGEDFLDENEVTAWMPLPKPYKAKEEE